MTKKSIVISIVTGVIVGLGTAIANIAGDLHGMIIDDRLDNLEKEVAQLSQCETED